MSALLPKLLEQIAINGPMSMAEYMATCLLDPAHGYYTTRDPLGSTGDFTTSPEISQMFGELIGLCLAQSWLEQGAHAQQNSRARGGGTRLSGGNHDAQRAGLRADAVGEFQQKVARTPRGVVRVVHHAHVGPYRSTAATAETTAAATARTTLLRFVNALAR